MIRQIVNRLLIAAPMVVGASFITFSILYFVPGDPVLVMLGDRAGDRVLVEKMRAELRLDDPFPVRYGRFLAGLARFDLGRSYRTNRSVSQDLVEALPASAELALAALAFAVVLGVFSGIVSAMRQHSAFDYGFMVLAVLGVSVPVFWLALLLNYLLAFRFPVFEMAGRLGPDYMQYQARTGLVLLDALFFRDWHLLRDALAHITLPAITLGLMGSALIARMTRSSVLEAKTADFVRTAQAKGLPPSAILHHILRNAMLPVITIVGLQFGALLGGAIITEEIFAWPGVGTYLIQAIRHRDIVAVQGTVMLTVTFFVFVNLVVDILYLAADPRTRQ
jgi:peptide/nickel transport system permease protein